MSSRLTRADQNTRNRGLVLAAARRTFLARGYHGATLEQIADEAGFSKGVVYSRFESKADLFLALLEQRIAERAGNNARVVEQMTGDQGIETLLEYLVGVERAEPEWGLVVIEFRVHAARDAELNRRYAALHERTITGVARAVASVYERRGETPPLEPAKLARLMLAVAAGHRLEQAIEPGAAPGMLLAELLGERTVSESSAQDKGTDRRRVA